MASAEEGLARAKRRVREKRNVMASLPLRRKDMARGLYKICWTSRVRERDGVREGEKARSRGGNLTYRVTRS